MSIAPPETDPTLPAFVPPTELVEATAAAIMGEESWATTSGLQKFHVRSHALEVLSGVGEQLVAATLDHITTHHAAFGFDERLRDELMFARMAGAIAALPSTDDDDVPDVPEPPD